MEFRLLGPVQVLSDGETLEVGSRKQRTLLALLVANADHWVSADRCLQALWGEDAPTGAVRSLHTYVSNLRRILDPDRSGLIEGREGGYRLAVPDHSTIDWREFIEKADSADLEDLEIALAQWRGRPLEDVEDDWARAITAGWEQTRLKAVERWADLMLATGDIETLLPRLEDLADEYPLHEPLWARLMTGLYRAQRQADALAAYRSLRARLGEELGIEPSPDLQDLEERILLQDEALLSVRGPPTNLPASLTTTVGRIRESETLAKLLDTTRLLTITGAGGVGKTTSARDLARAALQDFPDGVWWFELAHITDPELIIGEMLGAMRRPPPTSEQPIDVLHRQLAGTRSLLVFDNCEHLIDSIAKLVESVLGEAGEVKVVATSREPLQVPGEVAWTLPPLTTPARDTNTVSAVLETDAGALFEARARQANPRFEIDDHNAPRVAAICRRLDGLPFAIELAAARLRSMGLSELEGRLDDRFRILTGGSRTEAPHHRTLRGTVEWSYDLLDQGQRSMYSILSVFRGGFEIDAVERVSGTECNVELVDALVAGSLLIAEPVGDKVRYKMLETIREHAGEVLEASGKAGEIRAAHLSWVADLVHHGARKLEGFHAETWIARFRRETDNIRAALGYAANEDPVAGASICAGLSRYWFTYATDRDVTTLDDATSFLEEGRRWSELMLDSADALPDKIRARLLTGLGGLLLIRLGRMDEAVAYLDEARRLWEEIGNTRSLGWAVFYQGTATWSQVPIAQSIALFDRSNSLHETAEDPFGSLTSKLLRGLSHVVAGDLRAAKDDFEASEDTARAVGTAWGIAHAQDALSMLAILAGEHTKDDGHRLGSSIETFRDIPNYLCLCHAIQTAAMLFASRQQLELAARSQGVVHTIRDRLGMIMAPYEDRTVWIEELGMDDLDPAERKQEESAGQAMNPVAGVDWVLQEISRTTELPSGNAGGKSRTL